VNPLPAREVAATITATGVLTVWGLEPDPVVIDEGAPAAARNALINLLHQRAVALDAPLFAAVRTPAGPWYMAVEASGRCIPHDPDGFSAPPPELDPATTLAGIERVLSAAAASPQAALALASDPDPAIRGRALAELATWPDDHAAVAEAQLPASRLAVLAGCGLAWVRAGVAANPATDPQTLADLVEDPDPTVRLSLASRFDLEPGVSVQLAADPDDRVRAELSRNPAAGFLAAPAEADSPGPADVEQPSAAAPGGDGQPDDPMEDQVPPDAASPAADAAPAAPAPGPATPRRSRRGRALVAAVSAVAVLGVCGYAAATSSPTPAAAPAAASAQPSAVAWNAVSLPAGPDGPQDPTADVATGFAHTELGAALAAAHLSVRIDAFAGPGSFEPTITRQTVGGNPAALLAATRARYRTAAAAAGVADGAAIPTGPVRIDGWRIDGAWDPDGTTTVHLRVSAGGPATDYAIAVVWASGDYALVDPTAPGTFTTGPADPSSYRSF
jgi:hypothetical protein